MDITEDELNAFFESVGNVKEDPSNPFAKKKPAAAKPVAEQPATPSPVPQEPVPVQPEPTPAPVTNTEPDFLSTDEEIVEEPVTVVTPTTPDFLAADEDIDGEPVSTPVETPAVIETVDPNMTNEYLDYAAEQAAKPKTPMEVKEAADKFMADNGINPTEYVGDKPMYVLVEEAIRTGDSTLLNNITNSMVFGFGPKITGLFQGEAAGKEVKKLEELRAQMNPSDALAGSIIGSVAGPGLGVGALSKGGLAVAKNAAEGMGFIGRNLTKALGYTVPGAIGGAGVGALSAVGNDTNIIDGALLGGAFGAGAGAISGVTSAATPIVTSGLKAIANVFSPSAEAGVKKLVKTLANSTGKSKAEIEDAIVKNKDLIEMMSSFGIDPTKSGDLIAKITNDIASPTGASKVTANASESINEIKSSANKAVDDFRAPFAVKTDEGKDKLGADVQFAYDRMDQDALDKIVDEFATGPANYYTAPILRNQIAQRINSDYPRHLGDSGRTSVQPEDIQFIKGEIFVLKDGAKELTETEMKTLGKDKTILIKGKNYNKEDLFAVEDIDGGIVQSTLNDLNNLTGSQFASGDVNTAASVYKKIKDQADAFVRSAEPNLAEVLKQSSTAKGNIGVQETIESFANKRAPSAKDIDDLASKLEKEKKIIGDDNVANATRAGIEQLIAKNNRLNNLVDERQNITPEYRKIFELAGLKPEEIENTQRTIQRLTALTAIATKSKGKSLGPEINDKVGKIAALMAFGRKTSAAIGLGDLLRINMRQKVSDEAIAKMTSMRPDEFNEFVKLAVTKPNSQIGDLLNTYLGGTGGVLAAINAQ